MGGGIWNENLGYAFETDLRSEYKFSSLILVNCDGLMDGLGSTFVNGLPLI